MYSYEDDPSKACITYLPHVSKQGRVINWSEIQIRNYTDLSVALVGCNSTVSAATCLGTRGDKDAVSQSCGSSTPTLWLPANDCNSRGEGGANKRWEGERVTHWQPQPQLRSQGKLMCGALVWLATDKRLHSSALAPRSSCSSTRFISHSC